MGGLSAAMNWKDDSRYRLRLAQGFFDEAKENLGYKQYSSCVDNSQLAIENVAKAIISCFIPISKSHSFGDALKMLIKEERVTDKIKKKVKGLIPLVEEHGFEEHILSDYGDEDNYKTPWDIFGKEAAQDAYQAAKKAVETAKELLPLIYDSLEERKKE